MKRKASLFATGAAGLRPAPTKKSTVDIGPEIEPASPTAAAGVLSDTLAVIMALERSFPGPVLAPLDPKAVLSDGSGPPEVPPMIKPAPFPVVLQSQLYVLRITRFADCS